MRFFLLACSCLNLLGQTKPTLQPKEYGQWETISTFPGAFGLSPDGTWLATQITRSNRNNELRLSKVSGGEPKVIAFATGVLFSSDSAWAAYAMGISEAREEKLRKDKKPVQRKLGFINLNSGETSTVDGVESFAFSPNGAYLAMKKYAPEKPGEADPEAAVGAGLIVRALASGKDTAFGNASEFAWQDMPNTGRLLALAINSEDKAGNAIQLFDPETGTLKVLDSAPANYIGLSWRKKSNDLAVLKSNSDDKFEGPTYTAMAWRNGVAVTYNPAKDPQLPAAMRTVSFRKPSWSDDGKTIFLGVAKWNEKPPAANKTDEEEPAAVDIWHWRDADVMAKQKTGAKADAQRNMLSAWNLESGKLVLLAHTFTEAVTPIRNSNLSLVSDWSGYALERSVGRPAADISLLDNATGARTALKTRLAEDHYVTSSPAGKYLLYLENDHYWTVNIATGAAVNLTKAAATSFVNQESDATVKQKPAFGIAGWTEGDASVILYDKTDLWEFASNGSKSKRLTDGAADQVRHRYVKLDPDEESIDLSKPIYLSLFGYWTKKSGFGLLQGGREQHLVWADKSFDRLTKARDANQFAYLAQTFEETPNVYVGDNLLKSATRVTNTNPDQNKYAWGRNQLIEYRTSKGARLQAALYYPAGYEAGKQYPMIVYLYEKLSDNLHHYVAPSERDYYNAGAMTQHGYFVLHPDIAFVPREPGVSVVDCVSTAVKKVIGMGAVDPKRVGVVGHSWGGFDTAFLATHTDIFSAAVAGAPITDLVSNYGNHHWSSGIAETDHIETGQQRMEVPLWEDLQAYIRNSAIFNVQNMTTPLLIEVGDADGTVFFHQGVELYNIARRARKNVVLLVYGGEDHGLRKKADQMDYQNRIFAWFDTYLKGEPAPKWISEGRSYQERQQELKTLKGSPIDK